jgi:hypothetical protein
MVSTVLRFTISVAMSTYFHGLSSYIVRLGHGAMIAIHVQLVKGSRGGSTSRFGLIESHWLAMAAQTDNKRNLFLRNLEWC